MELLILREIMNDSFEPFNCEYDNLTACLRELAEKEYDDDSYYDNYEGEDEWEIIKEENDYFDIDASCKRFILRFELMDGPEMVVRTVQVPSNMYIETLANIIMLAFGRSDVPDNYLFEANKKSYMPYYENYEHKDETFELEDTYGMTIGDLLSKKGTIMFFISSTKKGT